ncbi:hypothetical protein SAMN05421671_3113 [Pimelobacter simplex]|nr:hypothetical protein SAMN05421671_3113 [Pimelobacter simplex]
MDAFRQQMAADLLDAARRNRDRLVDQLRQDLAAGRIWSSTDAGQEQPYRPRRHGCDVIPSIFWGDLDLSGHQQRVFIDPATGLAVAAARETDDGAFVITTLEERP